MLQITHLSSEGLQITFHKRTNLSELDWPWAQKDPLHSATQGQKKGYYKNFYIYTVYFQLSIPI